MLPKKYHKSFLHESCIILNSQKNYQNIWTTFVRKFVTKKFRKLPNGHIGHCSEMLLGRR